MTRSSAEVAVELAQLRELAAWRAANREDDAELKAAIRRAAAELKEAERCSK